MSNIEAVIAGTGQRSHNTLTFDASTGKVGNTTLFSVTGQVGVKIYAYGIATPTGSGTVAVGTATNSAGLIAATTATSITAKKNWWNATPAAVSLSSNVTEFVISEDIILTVSSATVTAGTIRFVVIWRELSVDGYLRSANTGGSASPSISPSASQSPSASLSPSSSVSPSSSQSLSPSASVSPSSSVSKSLSPSSSASASASPSSSSSASQSPSSSASRSVSPSSSSSLSLSPSTSASPSSSVSASQEFPL